MARVILPKQGSLPQNAGESRVIQFLGENLPPKGDWFDWNHYGQLGPEYLVIPNVEIPDHADRFLELDAIVIAPHAVYVIETKDWGPQIAGDDHVWYLSRGTERKNPHKTLNYKCRVLKSLITYEHPDLRHLWIQGIVVIASENPELDLKGQCKKLTFPLKQNLIQYIQDVNRLNTPKKLSATALVSAQEEITRIISGRVKPRLNQALIIQGFKVVETLSQNEAFIEYLAQSERARGSSSLKRLKVYTLPPHLTEGERQKAQDKLMRNFDALESIGAHPYLVQTRGVFEQSANQWVEVLDWSEAGTLRQALTQRVFGCEEALKITKEIALALASAHQAGIIHRNLKPESILLSEHGARVMDFDLAYMPDSGAQTVWSEVAEDKDRRYLPPELAAPFGEYEVFESSDLYSLGILLYEMLTGQTPVQGPEALQKSGGRLPVEKRLSKLKTDCPAWLDECLNKMICADEQLRFESVAAFLHALESYQSQQMANQNTDAVLSEVAAAEPLNMQDPNRVLQANEVIGDFRILKHLGGGGFAQVYYARHMITGKDFALKVNNQSVPLDHMIDEFNLLDKLSHPNIVKVYWPGRFPGGRYYIAMEYLKGESLSRYIWGKSALSVEEVLNMAEDILSALRYLHEGEQKSDALMGKTLYHRDIKPGNIIKEPERGYILIDFNIAKASSDTDTFVGTGLYLAPDMIDGPKIRWNASGDTFALGVTLYELLCRTHPYPNQEPRLGVSPIHPHKTQQGKGLPQSLADFLFRAVQPRLEERFADAQSMEEALLQLSQEQEIEVPGTDSAALLHSSQSAITISDLKEDMVIKGPVFPEPVRIVKISAYGDGFLIKAEGLETEKLHKPILSLKQLAELEIVGGQANYTGDARYFRLGIEAQRLALAYEYDPYFSLSIARVDPLPHQLEAVYDYFLKQPRIRFLLADDPGAGKTIMAGLLIKELKIRGLIKRILIVTPANLSFQWQREMRDKFREDFEVIRGDILRANYGSNPWLDKNQVVTSVSWISRIDDAKESLLKAQWDLVIVDEAHKMSATSKGKTLAYEVGEALSQRTDHFLMMTATPHKGDPDHFIHFLELLDADVFSDMTSLEKGLENQALPFYLRRVKEALVTFPDENGVAKSLFTRRIVNTTSFRINDDELDLYEALTDYVEDQSVLASQDNSARGRVLGFTMAMLQRRFASSTYALRRSLERMKDKREKILADPEAYRQAQILKKVPDDFEELSEFEQEKIMQQLEDVVASVNPADLKKEIYKLGNLIEQALELEKREIETKLSSLRQVLTQHGIFKDPQMKLLIFTEHKDTLDYLVEKLEQWGLSVAQIHGGMKIGDRDTPGTRIFAEREFRESCQVLVATEAAGEGINLQFCWLMINYDIPWNPIRLEQRMGRIHRYGQTKDCLIFNFVAQNTREGRVMDKLFERIKQIEQDLDPDQTGKVFNVLGDVFPANYLEKMLREMYARNLTEDVIKDRIRTEVDTERLEKITHSTLEGLAKRELNLSAILGKSAEARERRLVPEVIHNFFIESAPLVNIQVKKSGKTQPIYSVGRIPRTLRPVAEKFEPRFGKLGREYPQIAFDKNLLEHHPTLEWVTPGHPLFECVRESTWQTVKPHVDQGAVFYDIHRAQPARLDIYAAGIVDGKGHLLHKRLFVVETLLPDMRMVLRQPTFFLDLIPAPEDASIREGLPDESHFPEDFAYQQFIHHDALKPLLAEVESERQREVNVIRQHLETSLNNLIHRQNLRMVELCENPDAPMYAANIKVVDERLEELNHRLEQRRASLAQEASCSIEQAEFIGRAWVLPHPERLTPRIKPMVRNDEIEHIAVDTVTKQLESEGWAVQSVESENRGFDLVAKRHNDLRFIEVKGRSETGDIALSSNEYRTAQRLKHDYWLYVVFHCSSEPEIHVVRDPAQLGWEPVRIVEHWRVSQEAIHGLS